MLCIKSYKIFVFFSFFHFMSILGICAKKHLLIFCLTETGGGGRGSNPTFLSHKWQKWANVWHRFFFVFCDTLWDFDPNFHFFFQNKSEFLPIRGNDVTIFSIQRNFSFLNFVWKKNWVKSESLLFTIHHPPPSITIKNSEYQKKADLL